MSMAKYREGMMREQERLNTEIDELNRKMHIQRLHAEEVEKKRAEFESKNKELYKLLDVIIFSSANSEGNDEQC